MGVARIRNVSARTRQEVRLFEGEKWLVLTSLLGFLLSGICAVWVLLFGGEVSPHGNVQNAFSFNAAIGIFLLTTAAIIPLSGMGPKSRAVFRWAYIMLALYSYFAETVQNFRGVNPRFVEGGSPFDMAIGNVFTFVALLLVLFYLFFAVQYFRRKAYAPYPELVTGIRYAMVCVVLSFAAGVWISVNHGRYVGLHGNLIWLHGLGFHALQAVPLVAWLTRFTSLPIGSKMRLIHVTGLFYVLGLIVIGWQTYMGRDILEWSVLPIIAGCCFLVSLSAGIVALGKANSSQMVRR